MSECLDVMVQTLRTVELDRVLKSNESSRRCRYVVQREHLARERPLNICKRLVERLSIQRCARRMQSFV